MGEESLSEYLFWKWRVLDHRFRYLTVEPSGSGEPDTGADFVLELWILDAVRALPFLIQAKKFIEPASPAPQGYRQRLLYPGGAESGYQLSALLQCAAAMRMTPCYLIYSDATRADHPFALHLVRAKRIRSFLLPLPATTGAPWPARKRRSALQLDDILAAARPLHSLFCPWSLRHHPARRDPEEARKVAATAAALEGSTRLRSQVPEYVRAMLGEGGAQGPLVDSGKRWLYELPKRWSPADLLLPRPKAIGVYDLAGLPPVDRELQTDEEDSN